MEFVQVFNKLINDKEITPYRISKDTGIPDRMIGYWKNGDRVPSAENLLRLANYFNVSVDYLLGRTDNPDVNR